MQAFGRIPVLFQRCQFGLLLILSIVIDSAVCFGQVPETIRFNEDVRPILSNHCWSCHGRDDAGRQGGLRLDLRAAALLPGESGKIAIVPNNTESSHLLERILAEDPDTMMPPPLAKRPLTSDQKEILRRWIEQGAEYSEHWAFIPPQRPELPSVSRPEWLTTPIDNFILRKLDEEGLAPSAEVSPLTWLRRVTLDLTGLPPSLDEQQQFVDEIARSTANIARDRVVDRLLGSSRYAERMAMHWLDVARYADTNGYNNDETRTMWPWRDWVIQAFAKGMPYDQFLTEQLAGDLLPNATLAQRVATGFNRNHVLTTEGGIIEEEYHVEYVADRVHTTSTVFLALSMQCARCHDHKYDPLSQRDYYQLAAFFNNVPDKIVSYSKGRMAEPLVPVPTAEQQAELDQIATRLKELEQQLQQRRSDVSADLIAWENGLTSEQIAQAGPPGLAHHFLLDEVKGEVLDRVNASVTGTIHGKLQSEPGRLGTAIKFDGETYIAAPLAGIFDNTDSFSVSAWIQLHATEAGTVMSRMDDENAYRGYDLIIENGRVSAHFSHHWPDRAFKVVSEQGMSQNEWHHVAVTYDGSGGAEGVRIYVDGAIQKLTVPTNNRLDGTLKTDKPFHIGRRQTGVPFRGLIDDVQLYRTQISEQDVARLASGQSTGGLKELLQVAAADRSQAQNDQLVEYYLNNVDPLTQQLRKDLAELPKRKAEIEKEIPVTMVMQEQPDRRPSYVLKRGQYDQRGEQVPAALPAVFAATSAAVSDTGNPDAKGQPTRLELAQWLTNPKHPLTARVAVNRWWEMLFGIGLVETSEDFGVQGSLPSHPELLDWLATELVAAQWDQRVILKQLVLSSTYRQSADVTTELAERDPRNRLLARSSRFRLPAETVRDHALFVSGLLKEKAGGPSVRPYQPEGLWEDVSVERRDKYVPDVGDGLYRRSMYTFWKRTCPPPTMATFDAPDRETCVVRRARTNTPLQALVLLNDPTYLEAARKLAERVMVAEDSESGRWSLAFRLLLSREPDPTEVETLHQALETAQEHFQNAPDAAGQLLTVGSSVADPQWNAIELASWTTAMSMLLNLDEAISRP